jgi:hypothetical protein
VLTFFAGGSKFEQTLLISNSAISVKSIQFLKIRVTHC